VGSHSLGEIYLSAAGVGFRSAEEDIVRIYLKNVFFLMLLHIKSRVFEGEIGFFNVKWGVLHMKWRFLNVKWGVLNVKLIKID
jgi:hypothetical protein